MHTEITSGAASLSKRYQPGAIIASLGFLLAGGWLIAIELGAPLLGLERLWPLIPAILGLALLVQAISGAYRQDGLVFGGVIALLTGLFLCLFTFQIGGLSWQRMAEWWPVFALILGIGFMAVYLAGDMQEQSLLIPAYTIGGAGLFVLPFTLRVIGGGIFSQVVRLWPLLVALIILAFILRLRSR